MSKEDIVVFSQNDFKKDMSLSGDDIQRVVAHLEIVKEAVSKVLKEGINNDFGKIPGVDKKALFKPGAEKLMKLFGLGVKFVQGEKEFDRYENFAMFSYTAIVYHLKTGTEIASCEGTANSWEKKFKNRAIYKNKVKVGEEPVPVSDILNNLKKMAQKRGMVGAVILATGASDYFTQDEDEIEATSPVHKTVEKTDAAKFETKGESKDLAGFEITFGKWNGKKLGDFQKKEILDYVNYLIANNPNIDGKLKVFIDTAREFIR